MKAIHIPPGVVDILRKLNDAGHTAYVVGGAVRDVLRGDNPKDWDIATSATPNIVQTLFGRTIPTGIDFGTVAVPTKEVGLVEVTTYRKDGRYVDGRRPETVSFSKTLEEDLVRRDFTINAMALSIDGKLVDPFDGKKDLNDGIIRSVGNPVVRFSEDALRMMRGFRFAARFGFRVDPNTFAATKKLADTINFVSAERVFNELLKTLTADKSGVGLDGMMRAGLLPIIIPELAPMVGFDQKSKYHHYDLWTHTLKVVDGVPNNDPALRMAALLHDVAKPSTQTIGPDGHAHYYGHDKVGADMADTILRRLKSSSAFRRTVVKLVKHHMLPEEAGPKAMRRMLRDHGKAFVKQFLLFRNADHKATGRYPNDWKSRLWDVVNGILDTGGVQKLAVDGHDIMAVLGVKGPAVGNWKAKLEELILGDPRKNDRDYLLGYLQKAKGR